MKVDHIGYLVKDIDAAEQAFLALGYEVEQPKIFDKYRGIDIIFMVARTYVGGVKE